jgi:hypothetical protein
MPRPVTIAAAVLAAAAVAVSGCKEVESETAAGYEPAKLEEIEGKGDEIKRVVFTAEGAARTGLETAKVRSEKGGRVVLPYASLLYDAEGATWVYTNTGKLTYLREQVKVDHITGNRVVLKDGPAAGTAVVTVGTAEVYGTELEIAGSH